MPVARAIAEIRKVITDLIFFWNFLSFRIMANISQPLVNSNFNFLHTWMVSKTKAVTYGCVSTVGLALSYPFLPLNFFEIGKRMKRGNVKPRVAGLGERRCGKHGFERERGCWRESCGARESSLNTFSFFFSLQTPKSCGPASTLRPGGLLGRSLGRACRHWSD